MHILFLSDNFPPEFNAPASRTFEHAQEWIRAGHQVTVITTAPNWPDGKVFPGYRNSVFSRESLGGVCVIRVKTYITANEGFVRRTLDYLSFMVGASIAALFGRRPDVMVTTSPQLFCAMAGWFVAGIRGIPWVFELRDLWPASIVAVGVMKPGTAFRVLEAIELAMYRSASSIVALTHSFKRDLVGRGIEASKIHIVLNGVDMSRYTPMPKDMSLLDRFDLRGRFVVGYVGTHGMAHALDKVADAATLLRDRADIVFLFCGAGAKRAELVRTVESRGLTNVRMIPAQAKEMMPQLWSVHDLALITLRDEKLFTTVIPSKVFEAMGMGIPMLLSVPDGEGTQIIRESGSGIVVPPEDPAALARVIVELADDPSRLVPMRAAALRAASRYTRRDQALNMLGLLEQAVGGSSKSAA